MKMIGMYHISLFPDVDDQAFAKHMTEVVFKEVSVLQLTRITRSFAHQLLKGGGEFRQYVWDVTVTLETDKAYDFGENIERIGQSLADWGLVTGLDVYTKVES